MRTSDKKTYEGTPQFFAMCCMVVALTGNGMAAPSGNWGSHAPLRKQAIENLKTSTGGALPVSFPDLTTSPEDGAVLYISARPGHPISQNSKTRGVVQARDTAIQFIKDHGNLFHEDDSRIGFRILREKSNGNRSFVRMNQTYGDIPVFAAENVVQVTGNGDGIEAVGSDIMRIPSRYHADKLNLKPTLSADEAKAAALASWQTRFPESELEIKSADLVIYCPQVLDNQGETRLTWKIEIRSTSGGIVGDMVFIDAHAGIVAFEYPLLHNALNRQIYDSNNTSADPGTIARSEGQAAHSVTDVNLAYQYFGDTYNFYMNEHGRDSLNGSGGTLSATVRYCDPNEPCPYANAFWDGSRMYFGSTYASADDVVCHELTHGVTQNESNLVYANQSGAINESFSDMWGEWLDLVNGAGNDTPSARWQMGEDLPIGAIRNMKNPTLFNDPDRMGSPYWYSGSGDNGGVHYNSGVGNKLCYLLTDGDTFNGKTVYGFGISKTAKLFYEVQTNLLTSGGNYSSLYQCLKQAAINLEFSQADRDNLEQACQAVEINQPVNTNLADLTAGNSAFYKINKKYKMGVTFEVGNAGNQISDTTTVNFYYSSDGVSGVLIGSSKLAKVKPGKVKKPKLKILNAQPYYGGFVVMEIDPMNFVSELNEGNNVRFYGPMIF